MEKVDISIESLSVINTKVLVSLLFDQVPEIENENLRLNWPTENSRSTKTLLITRKGRINTSFSCAYRRLFDGVAGRAAGLVVGRVEGAGLVCGLCWGLLYDLL